MRANNSTWQEPHVAFRIPALHSTSNFFLNRQVRRRPAKGGLVGVQVSRALFPISSSPCILHQLQAMQPCNATRPSVQNRALGWCLSWIVTWRWRSGRDNCIRHGKHARLSEAVLPRPLDLPIFLAFMSRNGRFGAFQGSALTATA